MSYNISRWKTKSIENLKVPISLFNNGKNRFQQDVTLIGTHVVMEAGEGKIEGYLGSDGMLTITDVDIHGETSGNFFQEVFFNAMADGEGTIEAVLIWECGDKITRLLVTEAIYRNDEIELQS